MAAVTPPRRDILIASHRQPSPDGDREGPANTFLVKMTIIKTLLILSFHQK